MLNRGVIINLCKRNGESFLYVVCKNGYDCILECLFKNGVDINLFIKNGESFFYVVCVNGYWSIV